LVDVVGIEVRFSEHRMVTQLLLRYVIRSQEVSGQSIGEIGEHALLAAGCGMVVITVIIG